MWMLVFHFLQLFYVLSLRNLFTKSAVLILFIELVVSINRCVWNPPTGVLPSFICIAHRQRIIHCILDFISQYEMSY